MNLINGTLRKPCGLTPFFCAWESPAHGGTQAGVYQQYLRRCRKDSWCQLDYRNWNHWNHWNPGDKRKKGNNSRFLGFGDPSKHVKACHASNRDTYYLFGGWTSIPAILMLMLLTHANQGLPENRSPWNPVLHQHAPSRSVHFEGWTTMNKPRYHLGYPTIISQYISMYNIYIYMYIYIWSHTHPRTYLSNVNAITLNTSASLTVPLHITAKHIHKPKNGHKPK